MVNGYVGSSRGETGREMRKFDSMRVKDEEGQKTEEASHKIS